jgi:alcohol dehydrogenase
MRIDLNSLHVRVVQGEGGVRRLGELAAEYDASRPLVVTDGGIVEAGHVGAALTSLKERGLIPAVFDAVHENPTTNDVLACVESAQSHGADLLIGLGGGSSMDAAKGCNFILTNGGEMKDYLGIDKAQRPMLPFIAVPTTAGTGSECQRFALISDPDTHQKMACGDSKALARVAILDPALTLTQPEFVCACSGMDAVTHAVESAVTRPCTEVSRSYSIEAFRLLAMNLPRVVEAPDDLDARAAVQIGAALAGAAIEHSMLGAAHSAANPLTAHYNVVHGQAVGNMLPTVVRFNGEDEAVAQQYNELVRVGRLTNGEDFADACETLAVWLEALLDHLGLKKEISAYGVTEDALPGLAKEAAGQWTAQFNPRDVSVDVFRNFYSGIMTENTT